MILLSDEQIKDIAEELDMGMECYIHKQNGSIKTVPNEELRSYGDTELFEEELNEIEENWENYLLLEDIDSHRGYQIREEFVENIKDEEVRRHFQWALNEPKPFRNFRYELDKNDEYREEWFAFKAQKYEDWVRKQIKRYNQYATDSSES